MSHVTQAPPLSTLIKGLGLTPHVEGGHYLETYRSAATCDPDDGRGNRSLLTSIYYLLSKDSPIGHFHKNHSDIVHYFHAGDAITYYLIFDDGHIETPVLGPDVSAGQTLQLIVPGGVWKASHLLDNGSAGYGLIGEAVAPGFDYQDMTLADRETLQAQFPQHQALIKELTR
ncbi:cupin domain-containing protein [Aestuariibacter halophilus]|uniref:Cupin domain-containing protein n=1 Tax=Fluctibacter halophilus TaxID=226011 RepID=A0ABS8G7S6_9ALTE|nr:cupin domain-containing protein [Aestuariibacter halophilus]MCC2615729.1 cupin domain-containing protein [Aestuariibacter halophilus]